MFPLPKRVEAFWEFCIKVCIVWSFIRQSMEKWIRVLHQMVIYIENNSDWLSKQATFMIYCIWLTLEGVKVLCCSFKTTGSKSWPVPSVMEALHRFSVVICFQLLWCCGKSPLLPALGFLILVFISWTSSSLLLPLVVQQHLVTS